MAIYSESDINSLIDWSAHNVRLDFHRMILFLAGEWRDQKKIRSGSVLATDHRYTHDSRNCGACYTESQMRMGQR